jgi:tyrosine-protein kinase Fes/Fps
VLVSVNDKENEGKYLPKISDFGLAFQKGSTGNYIYKPGQAVPGSTFSLLTFIVQWAAPEVLTKKKFSQYSDVWSFGVTVWEIFSEGMHPYWDFQDFKEISQFVVKGGRLPKPEKCPDEVFQVMNSCWAQQPSQRPSFDALETLMNKLVNPPSITGQTAAYH